MTVCRCGRTKLWGWLFVLIGIITVLCCVPFWLWLTVLGCLISAVGLHILLD